MDPEVPPEEVLDCFEEHLAAAGKSANTLRAYTRDLWLFGEWFAPTNGKNPSPERITPTDVREYRSHLLLVENHKPATVNRKLSSRSMFCRRARRKGLMQGDPTDEVSGVEEVKGAPRALARRQLLRLLRPVRRGQNARDTAIVEVLANTGLRVGELTALTLDDVELFERKGWVSVRSGKGEKSPSVPLNVDAWKGVQAYL